MPSAGSQIRRRKGTCTIHDIEITVALRQCVNKHLTYRWIAEKY